MDFVVFLDSISNLFELMMKQFGQLCLVDCWVDNLFLMKISKLQNRIMFLSPTVQAGWESESYKSDFECQATLGQGSYGVVWKAKHKKTGAIYAIKEIKKKTLTNQKMIEHVRTEVKIMYCLNHPNIVKLYNHFEDEFAIYFVLEFAQKGELYRTLMKAPNKRFEQAQSANYISQIVQALQYIHKLNIIHRDIKPENILICKDDVLKLADFGWSNFTHGETKRQTYCGTLDYLAPEMVDSSHLHDYRVDIWSIGVLIYQLCTGNSPFSSQLVKAKNLSEAGIKTNIATLNYQMPENISPECKDLIKRILVLKPQGRISLEGILSHPWIRQNCPKLQISEETSKQKLISKLKHEFGAILQAKGEEWKNFEAFSKEQIYNCSRIESIINGAPKERQQGNQTDKKTKELELRIKQLELCNKRQDDQLKYLRNIKNDHHQTALELTQNKETIRQMTRKMQILQTKNQQYERIIKQFEKSNSR